MYTISIVRRMMMMQVKYPYSTTLLTSSETQTLARTPLLPLNNHLGTTTLKKEDLTISLSNPLQSVLNLNVVEYTIKLLARATYFFVYIIYLLNIHNVYTIQNIYIQYNVVRVNCPTRPGTEKRTQKRRITIKTYFWLLTSFISHQ